MKLKESWIEVTDEFYNDTLKLHNIDLHEVNKDDYYEFIRGDKKYNLITKNNEISINFLEFVPIYRDS